MNELGTRLAGAFGIVIALTWFALIVLVLGLVAFALRQEKASQGSVVVLAEHETTRGVVAR